MDDHLATRVLFPSYAENLTVYVSRTLHTNRRQKGEVRVALCLWKRATGSRLKKNSSCNGGSDAKHEKQLSNENTGGFYDSLFPLKYNARERWKPSYIATRRCSPFICNFEHVSSIKSIIATRIARIGQKRVRFGETFRFLCIYGKLQIKERKKKKRNKAHQLLQHLANESDHPFFF